MPITVIVRSPGGAETARLTFDGAQRVVIGRGAGSDVRLPEASVSHRHASLRAQGADFVVFDEGSTNGTFVGDVRVAPRTSRIIRSGSDIRLGRVWIAVQMDHNPVTRDVAAATRDLALALVEQAMADVGADPTTRVRVVEGRDQGAVLLVAEPGRDYVVGRGPHCDLPLADADASREHVRLSRRDGAVFVQDLGAKNGTWLGDVRVPSNQDVLWRSSHMIQIGRTVLALEEPVSDALARIESASDEALAPESSPAAAPPGASEMTGSPDGSERGASAETPEALAAKPAKNRAVTTWSVADGLVMAAALLVLGLSLAGMVWLLRG